MELLFNIQMTCLLIVSLGVVLRYFELEMPYWFGAVLTMVVVGSIIAGSLITMFFIWMT